MFICIPVNENLGTDSTVCEHFGSTPLFMIVDTDSMAVKTIANDNEHHAHGMCQPLKVLAAEKIDAIVVGNIGAGAIHKLSAANIRVLRTSKKTVLETVEAFKRGELVSITQDMACSHNHEQK